MFFRGPDEWRELTQRILAGDPGSENEFARYFYPHFLVMAAGRLRDQEAAREITHEVLLGVLQALREGRLREPVKLPAFVAGTARNLINQHIQQQIRLRNLDALGLNEAAGSGRPSGEPETEVEDEERKSIVRAALQMLRPVEQRILFLTLTKGLNPREIALKMDMKPANIRNRKSRALKAVRREVQKMIRKERLGHL